jgi:hypothetical protein
VSAATIVEDFNAVFEFRPVAGHPNTSIIHPRTKRARRLMSKRSKDGHGEMTAEDWDKFEKDIADAFEQVP